MATVDAQHAVFPILLALILSIGSLIFYLVSAFASRLSDTTQGGKVRSFNLAVPSSDSYPRLFAISLVAAQTPLSTVFVFFLCSGGYYGIRLFLCPVFFALGCWLLLRVYQAAEANRYFEEEDGGLTGLLSFLAKSLTQSPLVAGVVLLLSVLPLFGLLALELRYGIEIVNFLIQGIFGGTHPEALFGVFVLLMSLLLGYVFVGGFQAVVTSDVYQYKLIKLGTSIAVISLLVAKTNNSHQILSALTNFGQAPAASLDFYVSVVLANLFAPMSLALSWQRFRAFRDVEIDFRIAIREAIKIGGGLWVLLIVAGLLLAPSGSGDIGQLFTSLLKTNGWFGLVVFPLIVTAALSTMYSASDTCVSGLLFFLEHNRTRSLPRTVKISEGYAEHRLARRHYVGMALIFAVTLLVYSVTAAYPAKRLFEVAATLFGSVIILSPLSLAIALFPPFRSLSIGSKLRKPLVLLSLASGTLCFWTSVAVGFYTGREDLIKFAMVPGFTAALIPIVILISKENARGGFRYVRRRDRSRGRVQAIGRGGH